MGLHCCPTLPSLILICRLEACPGKGRDTAGYGSHRALGWGGCHSDHQVDDAVAVGLGGRGIQMLLVLSAFHPYAPTPLCQRTFLPSCCCPFGPCRSMPGISQILTPATLLLSVPAACAHTVAVSDYSSCRSIHHIGHPTPSHSPGCHCQHHPPSWR